MRKIALGLLSLFLLVGTVDAQEGKKALKKGAKMLSKYASNATGNADQLDEGLMLVEKAFESEEVRGEDKYYNMLGTAYNAVLEGQINAKLIDPNFPITKGDLAAKAVDAFEKVISETDDKGDKKDALKGLEATENHLNNLGIYKFQENAYAEAFDYFNKSVEIYSILKANDYESRLSDEVTRKDHLFYTGAAGYYGQKGMEAVPVLEMLEKEGTDKPLVYEALFTIYHENENPSAIEYLNKGREAFPDDTGLLFAEINYYLTQGKLDVLVDKLKMALEKEPDNVSIYNTLGNVYDQLNQQERAAGNTEKADEYFNEAMGYYEQVLAKEPENFDAVYSQGALYYNKAASLTDEINELANDFSNEGTKKYNALKFVKWLVDESSY